MLYGLSQPENTPEYDEWQDAQDEKKDLVKKANSLIDGDMNGYDDVFDAVYAMEEQLRALTIIRDELGRLEDDFPADSEPTDEPGYDDSVWEGDR